MGARFDLVPDHFFNRDAGGSLDSAYQYSLFAYPGTGYEMINGVTGLIQEMIKHAKWKVRLPFKGKQF
jgi:hypothetical protein